MLEIIAGRSGSGKTKYCLDSIKDALVANPLGRSIILLLPEHMTYKVERELATMLSEDGQGFCRCYIYGFRRFAYQVLQEVGGGLEAGLSELGRQLLLRQLIDKRRRGKELHSFMRAAGQRGFAAELGDIINELKTYCIAPGDLQDLAGEIGEKDTRLTAKLGDIAMLYRDFNEAMAGKYNDGKDIMAKLVERLPMSKIVQGADLWLDGFQFFNPLEKLILAKLFTLCQDVHITLTLDTAELKEGQPWYDVPREDVFYRSQLTRNYLLQMAEELGMHREERWLMGGGRYQSELLRAMEASWLSYRVQPQTGDTQGVLELTEAANPRLELEAMAHDIVCRVREDGYKWQDIGILIRDAATYESLAEMVLREYHIPFFNAMQRKCTHHPLAELVRSALAICQGYRGWSYENIFRALKTGFFKEACQLLPDTLDTLENYVLAFGIKGKARWTQEEPWTYSHRQGVDGERELSEEAQAEEEALLSLINMARQGVAAPLAHLQEKLQAAQKDSSARAMAQAVYEFFEELRVPEQLGQWAEFDEAQGDLAGAREHRQIWSSIMELLDQLVELGVTGEQNLLAEFTATLEEGLDSLSISLIPPGLDYVSMASFDQNTLDNMRAIYIVGANAGAMPRHASENIILSDADRVAINQVEQGSDIAGKLEKRLSVIAQENSYQEAYLIYKAFTEPRELLWVSYALSDDSGSAKEPARLVKWLRKLAPDVKLNEVLQGEGFVVKKRQALSSLGLALRHCKDTGSLEPKWQAVYNWLLTHSTKKEKGLARLQKALSSRLGADKLPKELAHALFAPNRFLRGSVTRLERYNSCPFQYFAQYGLRLQERRISQFSSMELGTLLHAVLREFGEQLQSENRRWSDVTEAEQKKLCHEILYRLAPKLNNNILFQQKQLEIQLRRIERTAASALRRLCALDAVSQLHPSYFEQGFGALGRDANTKALELVYRLSDRQFLSLNGQIDRIDMTDDGRYFMIMDYKTGNAAINLMDVYYGIKLQLLTYLLVAGQMLAEQRGEETVPVAMLYYFLKRPIIDIKQQLSPQEVQQALDKSLHMPGWIVADKELVELIDTSFRNGKTSRFIGVRLKKDDSFYSSATLKTERELELLLVYVEKLLQATGEDILSGRIEPKPYRNNQYTPCGYCSYRPLCGFDAQLDGFSYNEVEKISDNDLLKQIESELEPKDVQALEARLKGRLEEREKIKEQKADTPKEDDGKKAAKTRTKRKAKTTIAEVND